eukprot:3434180-Pleurochrysis_carterae.AAC.1
MQECEGKSGRVALQATGADMLQPQLGIAVMEWLAARRFPSRRRGGGNPRKPVVATQEVARRRTACYFQQSN